MKHGRRLSSPLVFFVILTIGTSQGSAAPEGQMTWGLHFSPTPGWFDPTELAGTVTSYHTLYALHDAMIRPSPGQPMSPSLAEAWSASPDGLVYEFVLRKGVKFHNGESVSAEDVRFSVERYRGNAHKMLKEKVASIEIPDPARVRFRLKQPWPDFMTFYSSATGAGWIVPWSLVPPSFEFYWQPPGYSYDAVKARQLLAEAGYPNGFDTGDYFCDAALTYMGEPVVNYLNAIGIRVKLRPIERAAFQKGWIEKKYRGLVQGGNGSFGNAATRIESLVIGGGTYVYGSYADIDGLFREQASELDRKKREALLHRVQQLIYEKVVVAPIWQNVPLNGVGPRVEESGIGLVTGYIFSAPYEDVKLKSK
jgi:ABC-type transport system substrate-binding protein